MLKLCGAVCDRVNLHGGKMFIELDLGLSSIIGASLALRQSS